MYSVLIVDDEKLTRNYLAGIIQVLCPQFSVTGIAADGVEAMELCKVQNYDLIITDIKMPEMDGLSFCKFVYESMPKTQIVILSGYSEFEFARTAMRYHVKDYILKPIVDENIRDVLLNVREELNRQSREKITMDRDLKSAKTDRELIGEFIHQIILGNEEQVYSLFTMLDQRGISSVKRYACMTVFTIDEIQLLLCKKTTFDLTSYHLTLYEICRKYCESASLPMFYDSQLAVEVLFSGDSQMAVENQIKTAYTKIQKEAEQKGLYLVKLAVGDAFTDLTDASNSTLSAFQCMALTLWNLEPPYFYQEYLKKEKQILIMNEACEQIYRAYIKSDFSKLVSSVKQFCEAIPKLQNAAAYFRAGSFLIRYLCEHSNVKTHFIHTAYDKLIVNIDYMIQNKQMNTTFLINALVDSLQSMIPLGRAGKISESQQLVELAKQYIYEHYQDAISLSNMADALGVNSCYLSDLFHKHLGESYTKYLLRIRMERAASILRNNPSVHVYKVAEQVGFVSPKHFISVFKKFYGSTPSAFIEIKKT